MISRDDLMHHRLQAWLRENKCDDLEYLGFYPDTLGVDKHWYRVAEHEVTVDCIEDIEFAGFVDAESDSL
jgi:hypothetical protein